MGQMALQSAAASPHCRMVAAFDPDPTATADARDAGLQICPSYGELLATGVDFVVIAGPVGTHAHEVEQAFQHHVHCLVGAPLANNARQAEIMVAQAEAAGCKLGVLVPELGDPLFDQLRAMIADDCLGAIVLAQACRAESRVLRRPPVPGHWQREPGTAGDHVLLQVAARTIHLLSWLLGRDAVEVSCQASQGFTALPQDSAVATAKLRGNVLCSFAASHLVDGDCIAVFGTDGSAILTSDQLVIRSRKKWRGPQFDYATPGSELIVPRRPPQAPSPGDLEPLGQFARWIDDHDGFCCPGEQGVQDLRLLDALRRASESGRIEPVAGS